MAKPFVFIGMETSGRFRRRFQARGFDVLSCDILPAEDGADFVRYPGVGFHQKVKPGTLTGKARRDAREASREQFRALCALPIARKVIENPIGGFSAVRKPSQIVQPYQFGDDASKATCFWYVGKEGQALPEMALPIDPAKRVPGRWADWRERWGNQTDSGQNRLPPARTGGKSGRGHIRGLPTLA